MTPVDLLQLREQPPMHEPEDADQAEAEQIAEQRPPGRTEQVARMLPSHAGRQRSSSASKVMAMANTPSDSMSSRS